MRLIKMSRKYASWNIKDKMNKTNEMKSFTWCIFCLFIIFNLLVYN